MRYLDKRVERICDELYRLRIVQRIPLTDLICKKGTYIRPEAADAAAPPWTSFDSRTMHWYGPDEHYWFRTEFTVPKALNGKAMWLNVRTQIEGDDGKNPQFLLFVNNVPCCFPRKRFPAKSLCSTCKRTPAPSTMNSISLWKFRRLTRRLKRCIMT